MAFDVKFYAVFEQFIVDAMICKKRTCFYLPKIRIAPMVPMILEKLVCYLLKCIFIHVERLF